MPPRRRSSRRGNAPASQSLGGPNERIDDSDKENAQHRTHASTVVALQQERQQPPVPPPEEGGGASPGSLNGYALSVLLDEEDSYRLMCEHNEHLARIRAYTDICDSIAILKKEEAQSHEEGAEEDGTNKKRSAAVGGSAALLHRESTQAYADAASLINNRTASATDTTLAPPVAAFAVDGEETNDDSVFHTPRTLSPVPAVHVVSRLEAEALRLAEALQASQTTVQQLEAALRTAQEAARQPQRLETAAATVPPPSDREEQGQQAETTGEENPPPPRHTSPNTVSSLTPLVSPAHGNSSVSAPSLPSSPRLPDAAAAEDVMVDARDASKDAAQQQQQQQQPPERRGHASPPRSPGQVSPCHSQRPIDVSEFFWTLQVAPPPSTLHAHCTHHHEGSERKYRRTAPSASGSASPSPAAVLQRNAAGEMNDRKKSYGATDFTWGFGATAVPAERQTKEEAAALACESAWVDSSFYCYNIMEEMSCLRVVRTLDDVLEAQQKRADDGIAPRVLSDEEMTRLLLDRTPATGNSRVQSPAAQPQAFPLTLGTSAGNSFGTASSHRVPDASAAVYFGSSFSDSVAHPSAFSAPSRQYRLPYLQRLWLTSVLRQHLLFLLVALTCVLLLMPGMILCNVNVFDAADGDDFYATRNRYGRTALLFVARLGSCLTVFVCFCAVVGAEGKRRQETVSAAASPTAAERTATTAAAVSASSATPAPPPRFMSIKPPTTLGTVVHLALGVGAACLFGGSYVFARGCSHRNLSLALAGMGVYGAGEALLFGAIGTIVSAEVGVAAGVNVSLQILLSTWLLVNAFGAFVFPKLNFYVYTSSQLVGSQVYTSGFISALAVGLLLLSSRDLIERAGQAHTRSLSPRKLWSAARHDVSLCFYWRALTVALFTAAMMVLMLGSQVVFVPPAAELASMAKSAKAKELMGTEAERKPTQSETQAGADAMAALADRWTAQQRHAAVLVLVCALLMVPLCFIPRSAAVVNRWCPVALWTTVLCLLWGFSTAATWTTLHTGSGDMARRPHSRLETVTSYLGYGWSWAGAQTRLTPSLSVCAAITGVAYTIVVSSLLRPLANAGVQLPVTHPSRWRTAFHEREHALNEADGTPSSSLSSSASASDALDGSTTHLFTETEASVPSGQPHHSSSTTQTAPKEKPEKLGVSAAVVPPAHAAHRLDARLQCVRMQLRGGPAVMTVLVCLLVTMVLTVCVSVLTALSALLTWRDEAPVYVSAVVPGVTWDDHVLVKSTLTAVLAVAMVVQWVEVLHRHCASCLSSRC